jgi:hypothetical protein
MFKQKSVAQVEWLMRYQIFSVSFVVETVSDCVFDIKPTVLSVQSLVALFSQLKDVVRVNNVARPVFVEFNIGKAMLKHNNVSVVNQTVAQRTELCFD